jgi:hypothetical protein
MQSEMAFDLLENCMATKALLRKELLVPLRYVSDQPIRLRIFVLKTLILTVAPDLTCTWETRSICYKYASVPHFSSS